MREKKSQILPPRGFRAAEAVDWVRHSATRPSFIRDTKVKGSRGEGIRYEKKARNHFEALFGKYYVHGPWFQFGELDGTTRWCQPDGLLFKPLTGQIILIECKLQHTSDAWWQTKWLYLPVLRRAFPPNLWSYSVVEVVKWYDPATAFPERVRMIPSIAVAQEKEFSVHIWKP